MVKKALMIQLWRIQQSQSVISLFFWALTLAGVFYLNYFHPVFVSLGLPKSEVFLGTIILFFIIIVAFLVIGLIYDRILKLWVEQTDVSVERNPYSSGYLMPKDVIFWRRSTLPIMRELARKDSSIQKDVEFMEKWIEVSMDKQKGLADNVMKLEEWLAK